MRMIRGMPARLGGAVTLVSMLLAPVTMADGKTPRRAHAPAFSATAPEFGAFTPAAADPRMAAAFARSGLGTGNFAGGAFRFTPSGKATSRRKVTVAVRARAVGRSEAAHALSLPSDGLAPSAYSLGASVGWKRFALSGDVAKVDGGLLPTSRESADIGLSYSGARWATKLDLGAERSLNDRPTLGIDQTWSVGLGGSYALTRNLNVSGGVRYKTQHEQLIPVLDDRRDSQAVYLGTTFKF